MTPEQTGELYTKILRRFKWLKNVEQLDSSNAYIQVFREFSPEDHLSEIDEALTLHAIDELTHSHNIDPIYKRMVNNHLTTITRKITTEEFRNYLEKTQQILTLRPTTEFTDIHYAMLSFYADIHVYYENAMSDPHSVEKAQVAHAIASINRAFSLRPDTEKQPFDDVRLQASIVLYATLENLGALVIAKEASTLHSMLHASPQSIQDEIDSFFRVKTQHNK